MWLPSVWWTEAVTRPLTTNWSSPLSLNSYENFVRIYHEQGGFLTGSFLDAYIPTQPVLLTTLILLALVGFLIALIGVGLCFAKCFGLCHLRAASVLDELQKQTSKGSIRCLLTMTWCCWFMLAFIWLAHFSLTLNFVTENFGGHSTIGDSNVLNSLDSLNFIAVDEKKSKRATMTEDGHVTIGLNNIVIKNNQKLHTHSVEKFPSHMKTENHLIGLYNDIRELGYEFKPLESDNTNLAMTAVFLFTTVFYFVCLVVIAICTFLSIKQKIPQLYNPMEMNRGTRASHTLHLVGLLLLVASPVAHFLTLPFIVYSHAHLNMCPTEQTQNTNMQMYANSNLKYFEVNSLLDFLNDLRLEQKEVNGHNCQASITPVEGLWTSLMALSWSSLTLTFCVLLLARYFIRYTESVSYNVSTFGQHHSTQILDTYASIPELIRYRQPMPAAFGTFVPHRRY